MMDREGSMKINKGVRASERTGCFHASLPHIAGTITSPYDFNPKNVKGWVTITGWSNATSPTMLQDLKFKVGAWAACWVCTLLE